jgi:acetyl esterase
MMDGFNALSGDPEPGASVADREIPGPGGSLPVRIYHPSDARDLPVTVYFHAGGFVSGSLESHDSLCRLLCNGAQTIVVALDYRLAPEHKFPAPVEDAFATLEWVAAHAGDLGGDASRLAVAGDSVGGGLAAIVSILARDAGGPALRLQVIVYPDLDWSFTSSSWTEFGQGYFVTLDTARWLREQYFHGPDEWSDWRASPLQCPDLTGVAPALVLCPEYAAPRSDIEAYARRLEDAGVPTTFSLYEGMLMGWWAMSSIMDAGRDAVAEVTSALRTAFAREPAPS